MIEEETHEKETVKNRFFAILHPLFLMMLGLLFYFFAFILIWFITELDKDDRRKDRLSYPIFLFTSYLSSLFGITDYVRRGSYSSTDYPYTASKGKNAFAGLVYAYGCTDACAPIRRF
ncbi:MAG: hypothetical protein ACLS9T_05745 [Streptococcus salivarius]